MLRPPHVLGADRCQMAALHGPAQLQGSCVGRQRIRSNVLQEDCGQGMDGPGEWDDQWVWWCQNSEERFYVHVFLFRYFILSFDFTLVLITSKAYRFYQLLMCWFPALPPACPVDAKFHKQAKGMVQKHEGHIKTWKPLETYMYFGLPHLCVWLPFHLVSLVAYIPQLELIWDTPWGIQHHSAIISFGSLRANTKTH